MDRQTLCDWVRRYNHDGIGGLSDAERSGRALALAGQQDAAAARLTRLQPHSYTPRKNGAAR